MANLFHLGFDNAGALKLIRARVASFQADVVTNDQKVAMRAALGVATGTGDLVAANNLSDVANRDSARQNLRVASRDDVWAGVTSRAARSGIWGDGNASDRLTGYGTTGLNIGLSDFSIAISASMTSWTPSATTVLWKSHTTGNNRAYLQVVATTGVFQIGFVDGAGAATTYNLAPDVALVAGETYHIVVTVDRDGSATLYINGDTDRDFSTVGVAISVSSSALIDIGSGNTNPFGAMGTFSGVLYGLRSYNRVMTAAQVKTLLKTGVVEYEDQAASLTPIYTSDFSAGANSWTGGDAEVALTGNTDGINGSDNWLKVERITSTGRVDAQRSFASLGFGGDKNRRMAVAIYNPPGSPITYFGVSFGGFTSTTPAAVSVPAGTEVVCVFNWAALRSASISSLRVSPTNAAGVSENQVVGTTYYFKSMVIAATGAFQHLVCDVGIGTHIPDLTGNYPGLLASTTGAVHVLPKINDEFIVRRVLLHSEISATGGTTFALALPPNCGVQDIEIDRDTAFDGGITLNVGTAGTPAKYASAMALAATGKVYSDSLSKAGESKTAFTTVYLQKSGATTVGQITLRIRCVIRGV